MPTVFLPPTSVRPTVDRASSLLPTPTASSYGSNQGGGAGRRGKVRLSLSQLALRGKLGELMLPTPTRHNAKETGAPSEMQRNSLGLGSLALFATPTETGNQLSPYMARWPGCVAWQKVHPPGPLSPSFVEWMMGFPTDWSDCEASVTPSCLSAQKRSER